MGKNIPNGRIDRLNWIESLIDQWTANQATLGLSPAQIAALTQRASDAREAFENAELIRANAKAVTNTFHSAADGAHALASNLLLLIKATAVTSDAPEAVYLAAGITPRKKPSPTGRPGQPSIASATLNGDGSVTLHFYASGPASPVGTVWQVSRRLEGQASPRIIGSADPATKSYQDNTLPEGTSSATYQIQGIRGGVKGRPSVVFGIKLGSAPALPAANTQAAA